MNLIHMPERLDVGSSPDLTARSSLRMRSFSLLEAFDLARLFGREDGLAAAGLRGLQLA